MTTYLLLSTGSEHVPSTVSLPIVVAFPGIQGTATYWLSEGTEHAAITELSLLREHAVVVYSPDTGTAAPAQTNASVH